MANIIPSDPKTGLEENVETMCETIPNAGKIKM